MTTKLSKDREEVLVFFSETFFKINSYAKLSNKVGNSNFNSILELHTRILMNSLYGLDLNFLEAETPNHKAIDLGDKKAGIAIQVTTENTNSKVTKTVDSFYKNNLNKKYSKALIVWIWAENVKVMPPNNTESRLVPVHIWHPVLFINKFLQANETQQKSILKYLKNQMKNFEKDAEESIFNRAIVVSFESLKSFIERLTISVENEQHEDIKLTFLHLADVLSTTSYQARRLLYTIITDQYKTKNMRDFLLIPESVLDLICKKGLKTTLLQLEEIAGLLKLQEYEDGKRIGARISLEPPKIDCNMDWIWIELKNNFTQEELYLLIMGLDFKVLD